MKGESAKSGVRESEYRAWQKRRRDGEDAGLEKDRLARKGFGQFSQKKRRMEGEWEQEGERVGP